MKSEFFIPIPSLSTRAGFYEDVATGGTNEYLAAKVLGLHRDPEILEEAIMNLNMDAWAVGMMVLLAEPQDFGCQVLVGVSRDEILVRTCSCGTRRNWNENLVLQVFFSCPSFLAKYRREEKLFL